MTDLTTTYLGLELRSPLVASASPLTGELAALRRLQAAGVGAVVLPSLFEEQIVHDAVQLDRMLALGEGHAEAEGYFPQLRDYNTGPERYLRLVADAKRHLNVPVIASINGTSVGGWVRYAELIEEAGADALELNVYFLAADFDASAREIEERYVDLVAAVKAAVQLPVAVKLGPYFSSLPHIARRLEAAGADGLVLFNRFYQPDIDLDTLELDDHLTLSTSAESRLPLRWIGILHGRLELSLAATTGIHTASDALKALLAGADVAMMTAALLRHGPEHVGRLETEIRAWMAEREYVSVAQLRGSASQISIAHPAAYERANYVRALTRFASGFREAAQLR
jgi:dihydroorotate dehydrogenase (fumarate)